MAWPSSSGQGEACSAKRLATASWASGFGEHWKTILDTEGKAMAIYEYFCPNCREVFEVVRPMKMSNESVSCLRCNAQGEKLPSVFASTADSSIKVPDKDAFRGNLGKGLPKSRQARLRTNLKCLRVK